MPSTALMPAVRKAIRRLKRSANWASGARIACQNAGRPPRKREDEDRRERHQEERQENQHERADGDDGPPGAASGRKRHGRGGRRAHFPSSFKTRAFQTPSMISFFARFQPPKSAILKAVLDRLESAVAGLVHAPKTVARKRRLRAVGPEKPHERVDEIPILLRNVPVDPHERVLGKDGARRIDDVGLELPAALVEQRLLLVRDERVAEPVLELGPGGARGGGLRDDVLPDAEEQAETALGPAAGGPIPGARTPR